MKLIPKYKKGSSIEDVRMVQVLTSVYGDAYANADKRKKNQIEAQYKGNESVRNILNRQALEKNMPSIQAPSYTSQIPIISAPNFTPKIIQPPVFTNKSEDPIKTVRKAKKPIKRTRTQSVEVAAIPIPAREETPKKQKKEVAESTEWTDTRGMVYNWETGQYETPWEYAVNTGKNPNRRISRGKGSHGGGAAGGGGISLSWDEPDNKPAKKKEIDDGLLGYAKVTRTFNDAFAEARKNKQKTFWFNNKLYTTELGDGSKDYSAGYRRKETILVPLVLSSEED